MDPIAEGSHERSVDSSNSRPSTQTVLLNEQLEQLRREIELLKATKTRTHLAPSPEESPRTIQVREEIEKLRLENERLMASKLASRTHQDVNRTIPQPGVDQRSVHTPPRATQGDLHVSRNGHTQAPVSPERASSHVIGAGEEAKADKYMIETPFASKVIDPSSKTVRTQSLPKPAAPPGASTRSLAHSRSIQVVKDATSTRMEDGNLPISPVMPQYSPPLPPRTVQDSGEQGKSMSPQTLQALGTLQLLRQEKEKLIASKTVASKVAPAPASPSPPVMAAELSSSTRAQINNNPAASAGPDVSVRTLQALDEVARVKREIEMLKASKVDVKAASKVEVPAMSDRTRQVMSQLEKVRRENAMLKQSKAKEMESAQRRLAYFEQNHAAASKVRMLEIKKMIITSQELDLAFLVDATGSMQSSIDMIKSTVSTMASGIMQSYPECKLRVAFVPYRDYEDSDLDDSELCDFTTSFSGPNNVFTTALSKVETSGGGDDAEDVFTGIARVAQLSWDATNRLLFHIADAPCHGNKFHEGVGDYYPAGDKYGRTIEAQLQILSEICHISTYFFCHINSSTKKMIRVFKEAAPSSLTILEEQFENISSIPHQVITLARGTIQKTLSVVNAIQYTDAKFVNEVVVKDVPFWTQVPAQNGTHFRCKEYRALDDMLSRISNKMALDEEVMDHIQVQIAKNPFSDEGAVRWPYHALISHPSEPSQSSRMVVKRFKTPLGKDVREVHKRERYWAQMEVQSVSAHMANEFNRRTSNMKNVKRVEFTEVTTLEVGTGANVKYYNMESLLEGEWLRYSNNGGYVNTMDYAAVLQAFTHWTHERSRGLLMVTDLQGVRIENSDGENVFNLCDPAIHCTDVLRFTRTNLGAEGFKLFFDTHKCNDVCEKLGLAVGTAGRTLSGTKVGTYW
ncbi:hypothetical protein KC19_11G014000 [Ceratodon purpureus]|uniref:Alpha-type protein kinase domain-containing protein n=1 Tax=Ceratodon purpureus TaxID=3225 RepID=A0A8T0GB49_CERPU|nr:hypothetical protein KC19_11G014000 [Ceratodon purpureus]